jgi:hypothetical protein
MRLAPATVSALLLFLSPGASASSGSDPNPDEESGPAEGPDEAPSAIINGLDASRADFPMAGALVVEGWNPLSAQRIRAFICSSTLIAPDVVLTAGHCLDETFITASGAIDGPLEFRWTRQVDLVDYLWPEELLEWPEDSVASTELVLHPGWDGLGSESLDHNDDIALMFLSEPVFDVPLSRLPVGDDIGAPVALADVWVVGWGQRVPGRGVSDPTLTARKQMGLGFVNRVGAWEFQVGADVQDARHCFGDSGGPPFVEPAGDFSGLRQLGVTSHTYSYDGCLAGAVSTRVDRYLEWIEDELVARCEAETRAWCEVPGIPVDYGPDYEAPEWTGAPPDHRDDGWEDPWGDDDWDECDWDDWDCDWDDDADEQEDEEPEVSLPELPPTPSSLGCAVQGASRPSGLLVCFLALALDPKRRGRSPRENCRVASGRASTGDVHLDDECTSEVEHADETDPASRRPADRACQGRCQGERHFGVAHGRGVVCADDRCGI